MFDFISKWLPGRSDVKKNNQQVIVDLNKSQLDEEQQKNKEQERSAYLQTIDATNDENALVDLILQCDFADGRLRAAQKISTQLSIEKVLPAMRKLDKRVAKLLQSNLDAFSQKAQNELAAQACIDTCDRLLLQAIVLSNQLVELDHQADHLKDIPEALKLQLQEKRQTLSLRLEQQIQLQQRLLGVMQELRQFEAKSSQVEDTVDCTNSAFFEEKYLAWKTIIDACASDKNAGSLPKNLVNECQNKLQSFRDGWRAPQMVSIFAPSELQSSVENQVATDEPISAPIPTTTPARPTEERKKVAKPNLLLSIEEIESHLQQMEASLEQGSVQNARKFDRELREVDTKQSYANLVLSTDLKERINLARKELLHLLSWAKWSGNASRDELVNTAEGLAGLKLSPQEIVGTVSALREQWKQTEASSGGASKELWTRFDAACTAAYAPAAQFFSEQSEQRKQNLSQAEAKLQELKMQLSSMPVSAEDADTTHEKSHWKAIANSIQQWQQSWRGVGQVDRKDKIRLDKAFYTLLEQLRQPLVQRQKQEIQMREQIIQSVTLLDGTQKSSLDQLRLLQQQWQMQAASIPLPRQDEQALWERFRTACDAVFEEKRAGVETADKQRQENLQAKEAICIELKETIEKHLDNPQEVADTIKKATAAWRQVGQVPRAQEQTVEKKFQDLLEVLQQQMNHLQTQAQEKKSQSVLAKLHICLQLESLLLTPNSDTSLMTTLKQEWFASVLPKSVVSNSLQQRFARVCDELDRPQTNVANQQILSKHGSSLISDEVLLHLEILLGIDSPAELRRERLQKQVDVLQASLRNGQDNKQVVELLNQVLNAPLIFDENVQRRLTKVVQNADLMVQ